MVGRAFSIGRLQLQISKATSLAYSWIYHKAGLSKQFYIKKSKYKNKFELIRYNQLYPNTELLMMLLSELNSVSQKVATSQWQSCAFVVSAWMVDCVSNTQTAARSSGGEYSGKQVAVNPFQKPFARPTVNSAPYRKHCLEQRYVINS